MKDLLIITEIIGDKGYTDLPEFTTDTLNTQGVNRFEYLQRALTAKTVDLDKYKYVCFIDADVVVTYQDIRIWYEYASSCELPVSVTAWHEKHAHRESMHKQNNSIFHTADWVQDNAIMLSMEFIKHIVPILTEGVEQWQKATKNKYLFNVIDKVELFSCKEPKITGVAPKLTTLGGVYKETPLLSCVMLWYEGCLLYTSPSPRDPH